MRYAVVGLGHFAQSAILPAFAGARRAHLTALVSSDRDKREQMGRKYRVPFVTNYERYDELLASGDVDAVYIALPNSMHADYAVRAARAGVHVLCEKPLAVSVKECEQMISACRKAKVKLMCAYRLHFEAANLTAAQLVRTGKLGEPKLFSSTFTMSVRPDNIRTKSTLGGGPLLDIGTYCINAARMLFADEPTEVSAFLAPARIPKGGVEDHAAALLRFPRERLATFAVSFQAQHDSRYELVGEKGMIAANPAYQHASALAHEVTVGDKRRRHVFRRRDQVAAELEAFSTCIVDDTEPEASGEEGLRDVRVIEALFKSAREKVPVLLKPMRNKKHPTLQQERHVRAQKRTPELVKAAPPGN